MLSKMLLILLAPLFLAGDRLSQENKLYTIDRECHISHDNLIGCLVTSSFYSIPNLVPI